MIVYKNAVQYTALNTYENPPSYPQDNHRSSDDVIGGEGDLLDGGDCRQVQERYSIIILQPTHAVLAKRLSSLATIRILCPI